MKHDFANPLNILLVGVGGQGILLAGDIIAAASMKAGLDVKKSDVHGMAQRGGSVTSQVRIGHQVFAPLIASGGADILVSFEKQEALRYADMLKPGGMAVVSDLLITPITVASGQAPELKEEEINSRLTTGFEHLLLLNANGIAEGLGNIRVANVVLTGALAGLLPLEMDIWNQSIREMVKPQFVEINLQAFAEGRKAVEEGRAVSV